jgi:uncharacterized membrane protein (UPF0127 family)
MKKKLNFFLISSLLLISCSNSSQSFSNANNLPQKENNSSEMLGQELPISAQAIIKGEQIELEVTKTPQQQQLGLMFRKSLDSNRGMLFSFSPPRIPRFWMKNVVIPLDILFIQDGKIKAISHNVPPCRVDPCPVYGPDIPIDMVIELKGGRASELCLSVNDTVDISFFNDSVQN